MHAFYIGTWYRSTVYKNAGNDKNELAKDQLIRKKLIAPLEGVVGDRGD